MDSGYEGYESSLLLSPMPAPFVFQKSPLVARTPLGLYPSSDLMVNKLESHERAQTSTPSNRPFRLPKLLDSQ
jgi:hypothetical protein